MNVRTISAISGLAMSLSIAFAGLVLPATAWSQVASPMDGQCSSCDPGFCPSCGGDCGCGGCYDPCGTFARVEYLMWWSADRGVPPLATSSPVIQARPLAGRLDQIDTTVLFGDDDIGQNMRSGGRVTIGKYLDSYRDLSLNGRFWGLEDSTATFTAASATGDPLLARPFFNTVLGQQDALLLAYPGVAADGSLGVQSHNDVIGADVYLRSTVAWDSQRRIDLLLGYQFTRMDDSIFIESNSTSIDPLAAVPIGTTFNILDSFRTQNEFHGGQIGFVAEYQCGRMWFEVLTKVALGNMRERAMLSGQTTTAEPLAAPVVADTGFLVQTSNAGDFTRDELVFIPEVGVTMGYRVNSQLSLTFGYSFLYWSDSLLAGDQIDLALDLSQPPPAGGPPVFQFNNNDFWVMGMNFGAEYRF